MTMPAAEELIELQTRQAFQEQALLELDNALRAQQQQIMTLERTVKILREEMLAQGGAGATHSVQDEPPPPHY